MSLAGSDHRLRWWIFWGVAALALAGATVLPVFHKSRPPPSPPAISPAAPIVIMPIDKHTEVGEQAILFDPKPLFLPTDWNTYEHPLPTGATRQPGEVFRDFEPKLSYGQRELALPMEGTQTLAAPQSPLDLLKSPIRQPFTGFAREDVPIKSRLARKGRLEVMNMATGEMVIKQNLGDDPAPPAGRDWQPVECLLTVNTAGLLGRPLITASSQVEEVDAYFRDYLVKTLHIGERLSPGFYRVVAGP